ncbi:cell division protein FtsB [Pseudomonas sp. G11-1]|uniref:Cell division protein FtsB n=1 Tax=Halopseudomonas bauzanensis TaxID=653930 RepID=A0A031MFG6_9GAMM|nr:MULTISPECIES: cell division protein FtsB [Halopseudomonas]MCO5786679.1 cell division protein FtsB [Pseudomonas sp. G11-1]MCO5789905.1 cell division protein FtsB [Pseudomonas sp. G11-2]EZQ18735.1 septum formation inhibitor [Halopseudomonas bauzanensis]TKA92186.1 cell division protein FtsB [Halopseudomonas bauzanensis]WGK62431.1 cell division protein FtsB [Halopseudomonas sp. SMJS2]
MKWLWVISLALLAALQYRLWVGEGSLAHVTQLKQDIASQQSENEKLLERNRVLTAEVIELKQGLETIEERARHELGMVKEGETLFQLSGND